MSEYQTWVSILPLGVDASAAAGLEARILDPMWLLVRQWQFNEFRHDGGASPVDVAIDVATGLPSRMRAATAATAETIEVRLARSPLEAMVEQENLPADGLEGLRQRAESGLFLQRLLRAAGLAPQADAWAKRCRFRIPAHAALDDETQDWFDTMIDRVPDGLQLEGRVARVINGQNTDIVPAPGELEVLQAWRTGSGIRVHSARGVGNWDPEHLEYRLSAAAIVGAGEVVLDVPEYVEGTLDWHAFDVGHATLGLTGQTGVVRYHRLPVPLQFAGMPNSRFWGFEDPSLNFDTLQLFSSTERRPSTAAMMSLEFVLSYGDDWCQVPLPLPVHSICEIASVVITDCFGDTVTAQRPAGRWNLFRHDDPQAADGLSTIFVNAAPNVVLYGDTLEEVHLLRDEQANLAWAIETLTPHPLGGAKPPRPSSTEFRPATQVGPSWTLSPNNLPRSWFPLVPSPDEIGRLALGKLWTARDALPGGRVLAELLPSKRLHDYEVPSEGVQVTRSWQSARAIDGSLHLWIGRAKTPRQTEIAPGLRFDVVEP
jgi:hypothetical protein